MDTLRTICNRDGISCRDSMGKLLSRKALVRRYVQAGGNSIDLSSYMQAAGNDLPDALRDYANYTMVELYTSDTHGAREVNEQRGNIQRARQLAYTPEGARVWLTTGGQVVYSHFEAGNVLAIFSPPY